MPGLQPIPDARVLPADGDPAEVAALKDTVRLAFVAALQHLPARQRAVLILREVLRWQASEVAELLDTSVASVNSALQRARATLAARAGDAPQADAVAADQQELLARYVDAFERYDIDSLVALLHDDAVMSMPPYDFWLRGPVEMGRWFLGQGCGCRGSRLVATAANGCRRVRLVPAGRAGRPRAIGHPGHRDLRRPDRRASQLPRHPAVRRLRPARRPGVALRISQRRACGRRRRVPPASVSAAGRARRVARTPSATRAQCSTTPAW